MSVEGPRGHARRSTVVVAEPQFKAVTHASVNAALLHATGLAFPESRRIFLSTPEHARWVREAVGKEPDATSSQPPEWRNLPPLPALSRVGRWKRLRAEIATYLRIVAVARREAAGLVLLCSVTRPGLILLRKLLPPLLHRCPVLVLTHQLNELLDEAGGGASGASRLRTLLRLPVPANLRFVAPAAPILEELSREFPSIARHFSWIDLPYFWQAEEATAFPEDPGKLVFGFFGVGRPDRIKPFCDLARRVRREFPGARFVLVGYVDPPTPDLETWSESVEGLGTSPLPLDELRRRASEVHYALWTAPADAYRMTFSATFLDALSHVKPSIFLQNPFISHYDRQMGGIGYPCSDMGEMYDVVTSLLSGGSVTEDYREQWERVTEGRRCFSVQAAALGLHRILRNLHRSGHDRVD